MLKKLKSLLFLLFFSSAILAKTQVACFLPLFKAFDEANSYLDGINPSASNLKQEVFLRLWQSAGNLNQFSEEELRAFASDDVNYLNRKLRENNFSLKLESLGKGGIGIVSFLDMQVNWLHVGRMLPSGHWDGIEGYDSVKMSKEGFDILESSEYEHPVAHVKCSNPEDAVYMTIADGAPSSQFNLHKKVTMLWGSLGKSVRHDYNGLVFPKVTLDRRENIPWLMNMPLGKGYFVSQALQQIKFRMDDLGAHTQSGFAMSATKGVTNHLRMDGPFYLWKVRAGTVVMAAYVDTDSWN